MPAYNNQGLDVNGYKARIKIAMDTERDKDGDELFRCAEELGKYFARRISVSQLRKVYSDTRKIKFNQEGKYELKIIKAMLGYTAGRFRDMREFKEIFDVAIDEAQKDENRFKRFMDFFQAVIAYHRAHGGNE